MGSGAARILAGGPHGPAPHPTNWRIFPGTARSTLILTSLGMCPAQGTWTGQRHSHGPQVPGLRAEHMPESPSSAGAEGKDGEETRTLPHAAPPTAHWV